MLKDYNWTGISVTIEIFVVSFLQISYEIVLTNNNALNLATNVLNPILFLLLLSQCPGKLIISKIANALEKETKTLDFICFVKYYTLFFGYIYY